MHLTRSVRLTAVRAVNLAVKIHLNLPRAPELAHAQSGDPHDLCKMAGGRGGRVVCGTINPSPSTDRHYTHLKLKF
jgi:hypothetical protein